jgi:tetratricopeptide (TPR) repeat protein
VRHILDKVLDRINKLKGYQAVALIVLVGALVYFRSLHNQFQADDYLQIVNNVPVHSIKNFFLLFKGGTFYYGHGLSKLSGAYYRPLMSVIFSLLYALFGANALYFHLFQLLLCIGSASILYLFFRYSFLPSMSILLALLWLIHPINSQIVYDIPEMQDALCFFFGILSLWLLVKFSSKRSLILVALSLFLALLSKETGLLFVILAAVYLFWWDRKRLASFSAITIVPLVAWAYLRVKAVGISSNPHNAPILATPLSGRLFNLPSTILFYFSKLIFPWHLASVYYWVHSTYSFRYFLLPLILDLLIVAVIIYGALSIRRRSTQAKYLSYIFFSIWLVIGVASISQIIPLDMTTSEGWFYMPFAGLLGMLGTWLSTLKIKFSPTWAVPLCLLLLLILGGRSFVRASDWQNEYTLDSADIKVSKEDYVAYNDLSQQSINNGNYQQAVIYAKQSIAAWPTWSGYDNMGVAYTQEGNYAEALIALQTGLRLSNESLLYANIAQVVTLYGNPIEDNQLITEALKNYPNDPALLIWSAVFYDEHNYNVEAKAFVLKAASLGDEPNFGQPILSNQTFTLQVTNNPNSVVKVGN